jgi:hypothetical protein
METLEMLEEFKAATQDQYIHMTVAVLKEKATGGEILSLAVPGGESILDVHVGLEIDRDKAGSLEWAEFSNRYLRPAFMPLLNYLRENGSIK